MSDKWITGLFILLLLANLLDSFFFQRRRIKNYYDEYRKAIVDGIIADLKKTDSVLVIDESSKNVAFRKQTVTGVEQ